MVSNIYIYFTVFDIIQPEIINYFVGDIIECIVIENVFEFDNRFSQLSLLKRTRC